MKKIIALLLCISVVFTCAPLSLAAGSTTAAPERSEYVANEVILSQDTTVVYDEPLPLNTAEILNTEALSEDHVRTLKGTVAYGTDIEKLCDTLEQRPDILAADPNYIQTIDTVTLPAESEKTGDAYNAFGWYKKSLSLPQAWLAADSLGSEDVTVAVLDTGVNTAHKEFEGAIWSEGDIDGYNALNDSADVTDTNGHGSHVAGIIAMRANDFGYVGIAPQVKIMPVKIASGITMTDDAILKGLNFAVENGADVINMSFSGGSLSDTMAVAYQRAARKAVLVGAAGNSGLDAAVAPQYPAACNGVIGVMSYGEYTEQARSHYTLDTDALSSFSNYDPSGKYYQIAAPGVEIVGPAHNSTTAFAYKSGTSQATPIVAGTAALYLSVHPEASPYQVKNALLQATAQTVTGYYDTNTYKRIDMAQALACAPCEDPVVDLDADARYILSRCFDEELETVHRSDMEALTMISGGIVPDLADYVLSIPAFEQVQIITMNRLGLTEESLAWLESSSFPCLYKLDISNNPQIEQLHFSPSTAPLLREMYADNCSLSQTDSFENLSGLISLSVSGNDFVTSYSFEKLNYLQELATDGCRLQDVRAFAAFENLGYLNVADNYITDISPLSYYRGTFLDIRNNPLRLGANQDYVIETIRAFMNDNDAALSQITFYYTGNNAEDKDYIPATQLSLPATEVPRTAQSVTLQPLVQPQGANVGSFCRLLCTHPKLQADALSGTVRWRSEDFPTTEEITVTLSPVSGFAESESRLRITAPEIKEFYYESGAYVLRANTATEALTIGGNSYSTYTQEGNTRTFTVPATIPYSAALTATPRDALGEGTPCPIGTKAKAAAASARVRSAASDKEEYFTGESALLHIQTDTAAQQVKVYDCTYQTATVLCAFSQNESGHLFTCRVPLSTAGNRRFKIYASAGDTFGIGAAVVRFTVKQKAESLKLSSKTGSTLFLSDNNDSLQLQAQFYPTASATEAVSYTSLNPAVAAVDAGGKVTAADYGQTAILARSESGLEATFPVIVAAPKMNTPEITEGYVGSESYIEFYTKGAADIILTNADGSPCSTEYAYEKSKSNIDGYDASWLVALYPENSAPVTVRIYAADARGISDATPYKLVTLQPIAPVRHFDFSQEAYSFPRADGAVKIALDVTPADTTEFFNWSISTNTVATMKAYRNYCVLTPKKTGSLTLSASCEIDGEECLKSVTVTFTEGGIYSAEASLGSVSLYKECTVFAVTDQSIRYLDITDTNQLSEEYADYSFYEDRGDYRYWTMPYYSRKPTDTLTLTGGDSIGNVGAQATVALSSTMPESDTVGNPAVLRGQAGDLLSFNLNSLPSRARIDYSKYSVSIEDESIASFSLGNVRLLKEGETTMHCLYGEQEIEVRILVSVPVEEILLSESGTTLAEGESYILGAQTVPESSEPLLYSSDNEAVATVNNAGVISAISTGSATITAKTKSGIRADFALKVKPTSEITALSFDKAVYDIEIPGTLDYRLLADADITNKITYESSNSNLLAVDEEGVFTAKKAGEVTITARADSGAQASATVRLSSKRSLALSRPQIETTTKSSIVISAMLTPASEDLDGYWYSDNPAVATVSQSGMIYTKSPGICNVYFCTVQGEIASCLVKVNDIALSRLTMPSGEINLNLNEHYIVEYGKNLPYSAEMPQWKSDDPSIAAVDQNGIIYAVGEGSTTVIASLKNGKLYPITVNVNAGQISLRGTTASGATLKSENLIGTQSEYAVEGAFTITPFAGGTYTLTLTAPHHTSLTITDATIFETTDLGLLRIYNGDANGDGVVDIADISLLLQAGNYGSSAQGRENLDMDDSGSITIADIAEILLAENYSGTDKEIIY